ncbi:MAG: hypothetical protein ACRCW6_00160 [Mycoplasmoidaceae bacterium]
MTNIKTINGNKIDWWSASIGTSMLINTVGSLFGTTINAIDSLWNSVDNHQQQLNQGYGYNQSRFKTDEMFMRISKYPSKSIINFMGI